ncbi:MAG: transferase [Rhodospirillales bacterium]|nr:transferase [Rhodospirillales bacterium]
MSNSVQAKTIAEFLGWPLVGDSVDIEGPATIRDAKSGNLIFVKSYSDELCEKLNALEKCLALVPRKFDGKLKIPHILCENSRLDFARSLAQFFDRTFVPEIQSSASIAPGAKIGENCYIGHNVVIEDTVTVGNNCEIQHGVIIAAGTTIGNCIRIKSNTVVGQKGFGFEKDEDGIPHVIPHTGGVIIGNFVELGALNTVVAGTMSPTQIGDHVKTDDHVHIAHNVTLGPCTLVAACAEISGSVDIGRGVWIGPHSSIMNGVTIGKGAVVGLGAVVRKNIADGATMAGNPARVVPSPSG